jgi:hypothetical protein
VDEEEWSKAAVGWVGLPSRLTGWIGVKVAVDMRCRGMLLRGKLWLSRSNICRYASKGVCRGASFNTGDLAGRVLGYRKQASCGMQSEQS